MPEIDRTEPSKEKGIEDPLKADNGSKAKEDLKEYMVARAWNWLAAVFSGLAISVFFSLSPEYPDGAVKFLDSQFQAVSLTRGGWPFISTMLLFVLISLVTGKFSNFATIIWDGLSFAVFSATSVAAGLMIISYLGSPGVVIPPHLAALVAVVLIIGGLVYSLATPFILYSGLKIRDGWTLMFLWVLVVLYFSFIYCHEIWLFIKPE